MAQGTTNTKLKPAAKQLSFMEYILNVPVTESESGQSQFYDKRVAIPVYAGYKPISVNRHNSGFHSWQDSGYSIDSDNYVHLYWVFPFNFKQTGTLTYRVLYIKETL